MLPPDLFSSTPTLLAALSRIKKGTATGPFADSTDFIRDFASFHTHHGNTQHYPHLQLFRRVFLHIANGQLPHEVAHSFASQYFLALHKDPQHLDKLRPIGVGTSWRRVVGALLTAHFSPLFAHHLLPHQCGIAVQGGLQFITHSIQVQAQSLLPSAFNPSGSHILLQLDLANMFNSISRTHIRTQLDLHFPQLTPFFDTLYTDANSCFYRDDNNNWLSFLQPEGVTQGCSLSSMLATLGLHPVLQACSSTLTTLSPDAPAVQLAYMDDVSSVMRPTDLGPYLSTFNSVGSPIGARINPSKTTILSTLDPLCPNLHPALPAALQLLPPTSHLTHGTCLLGTPIGSQPYIEHFLSEASNTFRRNVHCIVTGVSSFQVQFQLFRFCAQSTLPHLLATDFLLRFTARPPDAPLSQPFAFHSPFISSLSSTTSAFLSHLTYSPDVTLLHPSEPAWTIAHLPTSMGGLGLQDFSTHTVTSFVVPLLRSIHMALKGFAIHSQPTPLPAPPTLAAIYSSWHSAPQPIFRALQAYAIPLMSTLPSLKLTPTSTLPQLHDFLLSHPIRTLQRDLCRNYKKSLRTTLPQRILSLPPDAVSNSLLTPLTSFPLASAPRSDPDFRVPNPTYRFSLSRKLRLPLSPTHSPPLICSCGTHMDPYGDHFFSCSRHSKLFLSNTIRNALWAICHGTTSLAGFTTSYHDVLLEPQHLSPSFPLARPADVGLKLTPSYLADLPTRPAAFLAIDVSVTPVPPVHSDPLKNADSALQTHIHAEGMKFTGRDTRHTVGQVLIHELTSHNIALIPFTVDPLGGLGPFATSLLFRPLPTPHPPTPFIVSDCSRSTRPLCWSS